MQAVAAIRQDFGDRMAFAGHKFPRLVQVLIAHLQRSIGIDPGEQIPQQNFASAISCPDYIFLLVVMKARFGSRLAMG